MPWKMLEDIALSWNLLEYGMEIGHSRMLGCCIVFEKERHELCLGLVRITKSCFIAICNKF
jgi:hypothetical protein